MPTPTNTDYVPLTLSRSKEGLLTGSLVYQGQQHAVTAKRIGDGRWDIRYDITVDGKKAGTLTKRGTGRNLTWGFNGGSWGGTLVDNVDRLVRSHLHSLEYAQEENAKIDTIKSVLPYVLRTEPEALDFAFTDRDNAKIVASHHGAWYIGFHHPDMADAVVATLKEKVDSTLRVRVYGKIDPRVVQAALTEQGVTGVHFDSTYTETVVYLNGNEGVLHVSKDGDVTIAQHDASGGVASEVEVYASTPRRDVEDVVTATVRWWKSWDLQQRAQSLLEHLETEVPDGVAHYAVEDAKKALRTLSRQAYTVDFTFQRSLPTVVK